MFRAVRARCSLKDSDVIRRKQDRIFARIEGIKADFPKEWTSKAPSPPPEDEAGFDKLPRSITETEIKRADFCPTAPAGNPPGVVQAALAEPELVCEPAPVFPHEDVPVRCPTPGEADIFASLESSFVPIAPGTFLMGSPESEPGRGSDEVLHEVTLTRAFHMQKAAVTQGLWKAVMGIPPASFEDGGEDLPVVSISWNECQEFLRRLNSMRGSRYRLPTEAEWEYACRAGSGTAFANGDISELYRGYDLILWRTGWYCVNSGRKSQPVAQKSPNAWQLYDMHGNVSEWRRGLVRRLPLGGRHGPLWAKIRIDEGCPRGVLVRQRKELPGEESLLLAAQPEERFHRL